MPRLIHRHHAEHQPLPTFSEFDSGLGLQGRIDPGMGLFTRLPALDSVGDHLTALVEGLPIEDDSTLALMGRSKVVHLSKGRASAVAGRRVLKPMSWSSASLLSIAQCRFILIPPINAARNLLSFSPCGPPALAPWATTRTSFVCT